MKLEKMQAVAEVSCMNPLCVEAGDGFSITKVKTKSIAESDPIVFRKTCNSCGDFFDIKYRLSFEYGFGQPEIRLVGIEIPSKAKAVVQ